MVHATAQGRGMSSGELREEGDAEMRREGGMSAGRRHEVSDWTSNPAPPGHTWVLPLTASVAEVFSCPHTHEYSPASSVVSSRISSSHTAPSCLRLTLSPALRVSGPFLHSTGAALLSSQHSVTVAPSVASSFFRPFVKLAVRAGDGQKDTNTITLSEHTEATGCEQCTEDIKPNWTWPTCWGASTPCDCDLKRSSCTCATEQTQNRHRT